MELKRVTLSDFFNALILRSNCTFMELKLDMTKAITYQRFLF